MNRKQLVSNLDGLLKPEGFVRRGTVWNRRTVDFIDVLNVETSKAGDAVTINSGVCHVETHRICWGTVPDDVLPEPYCTVRSRIGDLVDGREIWWGLSDMSDPKALPPRTEELLRSSVLPFFVRMHSESEMRAFLAHQQVVKRRYPPPILYLAILTFRQGERVVAKSILATLYKETTDAWRPKIVDAANRLGVHLQ